MTLRQALRHDSSALASTCAYRRQGDHCTSSIITSNASTSATQQQHGSSSSTAAARQQHGSRSSSRSNNSTTTEAAATAATAARQQPPHQQQRQPAAAASTALSALSAGIDNSMMDRPHHHAFNFICHIVTLARSPRWQLGGLLGRKYYRHRDPTRSCPSTTLHHSLRNTVSHERVPHVTEVSHQD